MPLPHPRISSAFVLPEIPPAMPCLSCRPPSSSSSRTLSLVQPSPLPTSLVRLSPPPRSLPSLGGELAVYPSVLSTRSPNFFFLILRSRSSLIFAFSNTRPNIPAFGAPLFAVPANLCPVEESYFILIFDFKGRGWHIKLWPTRRGSGYLARTATAALMRS